jgi:hypothetical protein
MKWIYDGPCASVDVAGVTAVKGEPVELPDDVVLGADWFCQGPHEGPATGVPRTQQGPTVRVANESMTVAQLRDIAAGRGVDVPKGARKADLLDLLTPASATLTED